MTQALKPVTRLTFSQIRERGKTRQIAVTIHATWLQFRLKGNQRSLLLDVEAAYSFAAKLEAIRDRQDRLKARAARNKETHQ